MGESRMSDKLYGNTSLAMHFDGAHGSNVFEDVSLIPHAFTAHGGVAHSNSQPYINETAAYFDGVDDWIEGTFQSQLLMGTRDFSIEVRVWLASTPNGSAIVSNNYAATNNVPWTLTLGDEFGWNDTKPIFGWYTGVWHKLVSPDPISLEEWHTIEVSRRGNTLYLFVDGDLKNTMAIFTALPVTGQQLRIGRRWDDAPPKPYFHGYISELRVTKHVARHAAPYTPSTTRFEDTPPAGVISYGILASAFAQSNSYSYAIPSLAAYDPAYLSPWHDLYFSQTQDMGHLRYTFGPPNQTIPVQTKLIEWDTAWRMFSLIASNGTWYGDNCDTTYEFLDADGVSRFVLRLLRDGEFRHGLWYGTSTASLTKAGQTGPYPRANGDIEFKFIDGVPTVVYTVSDFHSTNYNNPFTFEVDFREFKTLRATTYAHSTYQGTTDNVGAAYSVLNLLYRTETPSYSISGVVRDGGGTPVERTVHLYNRETGSKMSSTISDESSGQYSFELHTPEDAPVPSVFVVCLPELSDSSNAKIWDRVVLEPD